MPLITWEGGGFNHLSGEATGARPSLGESSSSQEFQPSAEDEFEQSGRLQQSGFQPSRLQQKEQEAAIEQPKTLRSQITSEIPPSQTPETFLPTSQTPDGLTQISEFSPSPSLSKSAFLPVNAEAIGPEQHFAIQVTAYIELVSIYFCKH